MLAALFTSWDANACQCPPPFRFVTDTVLEGQFRVKKFLLDSLLETQNVVEADLAYQLRKDFESSERVLHTRLERANVVTDSGKLVESLDPKYAIRPDSVGLKVLGVMRGVYGSEGLETKWGGHQCDFGNFGHLKDIEFFALNSAGQWWPSLLPMEECGDYRPYGTWVKGGRIYRSGFGDVSIPLSEFESKILGTRRKGQLNHSLSGSDMSPNNRISRLLGGFIKLFDLSGRQLDERRAPRN
ncbi:MAG: hypothetical protein ABIW76_16295 [Fibrobacteria bacterium]